MSQAGIINVIENNPTIPIYFEADTGFAVALFNVIRVVGAGGIVTSATGNTITIDGSGIQPNLTLTGDTGGPLSPTADNWNIVGGSVAAATTPVQVNGAVSTLTVNVQRTQAVGSSAANRAGIGSFNSAQFSVDSNGYVSLLGGAAVTSFDVDANTAPGTDPVVPNGSGVVAVTGGQVAAGTTANVIRTASLAANSYTIQIQRSSAQAVSTVGANGVSHFDSARFTVDSNGFVSLNGAGVAQTITGDSGGALSPTAGNWNILGSGSLTTSGAASTLTVQLSGLTNHAVLVGAGTSTITKLAVGTNGQVLIGATGADPAFATLTSSDGSITFTPGANSLSLQVTGGTTVGKTITGNTGGALSPTSGNWNIVTSNSTPTFIGSGSTLTLNFNLNNLLLGASGSAITTAFGNTSLGGGVGGALGAPLGNLTSGQGNVAVGWSTASALTTGSNNVLIGQQAGTAMTTGIQNNAIGSSAMMAVTTGGNNTCNGQNTLPFLVTGSYNTALGVNSGANYNGAESSNVLLRNSGTNGESNTMRLGSHGSGNGQVNRAFIAGINGNTVSNTQMVTIDSSTNQLGTQSANSSLVTTYTASGSWTINPRTKTVRFLAWGGGGGGGSGRCGASGTAGGGGGGAGGSYYDMVFNASDLTGSPYTVTIGTGGTGATSVNATTTNGNPGNPGGNTTVGSVVLALGGPGGSGGTTSSGAGGTPSYLSISGITTIVGVGSAGSNGVAASGSSFMNAYDTGGGGGSGYLSATPRIGGSAGSILDQANNVLVAGGTAGANTGATAGNGNSPSGQTLNIGGTGGGGGGHNGTATAGTGGNGAFPGGGGGGGAGNLNANASGAGGNGANGYLIIIEYF